MINSIPEHSATIRSRLSGRGTWLVVFSAVIFLMVSWLTEPEPGIKWVNETREEVAAVPLDPVQIGPYQLAQHADSYVLWTESYGADFEYVRYPWYLLLAFFSTGLAMLLAIHSTLKRFWFFCLSGLVALIVAYLRPEGLWGTIPYPWPAIVIVAWWLTPGLLLQFSGSSMSLWKRFAMYSGVLLITWTVLILASPQPEPVILLTAGLVPSGLILTCVLLVISAHEMLAWVAGFMPRTGSGKHFRDFLLIALIYLLNLLAAYLAQKGWFSWDYGVSPVVLMIVSGLLAIRSAGESERQSPGIPGTPEAARLGVAALAVIAFSVLGFIYASGNDVIYSNLKDFSLYTHFGFGLMFVLYVVMNFSPLMVQNTAIGSVLYQPSVTSMFFFRLSGLLAVSVFLFANVISRPILELRGGLFNVQADYHTIAGQTKLAEGYYTQAGRYAFHNQHSNYILAAQARDRYDYRKQQILLQDAAERRPLAEAYVNLAELLAGQNRLLDAYAWLKQGLAEMPGNKKLHQALGLLEYRLGAYDSAYWHFERSDRHSGSLNTTALIAMKGLRQSADSLLEHFAGDVQPAINILTLASRQRKVLPAGYQIPKDSMLNSNTATFLNNYIINHRDSLSESELEGFSRMAVHQGNLDFSESLNLALAFAFYSQGQLSTAFFHMERAAIFSQHKARYNHIMALWALEAHAAGPALASSRFATDEDFQEARVTYAVALMESGRNEEALSRWKSPELKNHPLTALSLKALETPVQEIFTLAPVELYAWTRYHAAELDSQQFRLIADKISDTEARARAVLDRSRWLFRNDRTAEAVQTYRSIAGLAVADERLFHQIQLHELRLLAWTGDIRNLEAQMKKDFNFLPAENTDRRYFEGVLAMAAGDTSRAAQEFAWITRHNLWHEEAVLTAAAFYREHEQYPRQAYNLLAKALHTNPQSVRLLMAFIRACYQNGEGSIAEGSIRQLQHLLPVDAFQSFMQSLPKDVDKIF